MFFVYPESTKIIKIIEKPKSIFTALSFRTLGLWRTNTENTLGAIFKTNSYLKLGYDEFNNLQKRKESEAAYTLSKFYWSKSVIENLVKVSWTRSTVLHYHYQSSSKSNLYKKSMENA